VGVQGHCGVMTSDASAPHGEHLATHRIRLGDRVDVYRLHDGGHLYRPTILAWTLQAIKLRHQGG
jgi:hypothetical protein